ncbi:collagen-like protein [Pasteurella multocida]|uniref:collagen-like protein n=1 Tax=Pasteurella multocida TaxID=747 RepID=UPI0009F4BB35|nr:collagen-like protein [Pasteurella multocida]MEB3450952.1 collagen-like protein [Pasteurella multocida]MEB3452635.1 collagen-like protein [Pasteurella multocida]MEB3455129.1 collagen-like protein [Pasteurella multocida]MEB3460235.1 collagen-like protein [Pasteurella multocida]MEB3462371.1 collagen-like protein [Pasteurella multocida]
MANLNKRLIDFAQAVSEKLLNVLNKIKELEQTIQTIRGIKGDKGDTGPQGPVGEQGPAGRDGIAGPSGSDGRNGYTFTPSLSSAGILSWTNDGNLANPSSINIKGPKGDIGPRGPIGPQGEQGPIGLRGPAGYEGEISDSYNGNRRNVPVSEYAVGLLHSKMEQLKETKQVWVGNVTQHSTNIIELSESILNKTLIFYMQYSQGHSLSNDNNVHTVSLYVDSSIMNVTGRKYCHGAFYAGGWKNCQIELVSENQIRIIDISSMYLKKITAV